MNILDSIEKKSLIIMPNSIKISVLKNINILADYKCITKEEFIRKMTFEYTMEAVDYLIEKYHFTVENSYEILNNLIYLEAEEYSSVKLNFYNKIRNELLSKSLIKSDHIFYNSYQKVPFFVYGYKYVDKFFKKQLSKFNYKIIESSEENIINVIEVSNQEEHLNYIFNKVFSLLDQGITLDKIKIGNIPQKDLFIFKRTADIYQLKISCSQSCMLSEMSIIKDYLELLKNHSIVESISLLSNVPADLLNKIISISNKFIKTKNYNELLKYEFDHTKYQKEKVNPVLELINLNDYEVNDDEYLLVYNLSKNSLIYYQDDEFFSDIEKKELDLETSIELNNIEKKKWIYLLKKTKSLFVYYIKKDSFAFDNLNINIIKPEISNYYCKNILMFSLGEKLDDYSKYRVLNYDLINLYNNLKINYLSYDNNYQKINQSLISDSLSLSYTSLNDYYQCQYKYYLKYLLKFVNYEENFYLLIGNLFHYMLERFYQLNFDFEKEWTSFLNNKKISPKEDILLIKMKEEMKYIIKQLIIEKELMNIKEVICEDSIKVIVRDKINFNGKIDKIIINHPNLVSVVDYKTGGIDKDLNNNKYGLNLQLPCYLYLLKKSTRYSGLEPIGFYYQQLINSDFNKNKSPEENKNYNLKLQGYTLNEEEKVKQFDSSYENSQIIKGLKLSEELKGSLKSKTEIDSLIELVEEKIITAAENIFDNNFIINPKVIKTKNNSCKNCEYKDICYVKNENVIYLDGEVIDDEELD